MHECQKTRWREHPMAAFYRPLENVCNSVRVGTAPKSLPAGIVDRDALYEFTQPLPDTKELEVVDRCIAGQRHRLHRGFREVPGQQSRRRIPARPKVRLAGCRL